MPLPPLQLWTRYEFSVAEISDHLEGNPSGTQKTSVSFFTISKQWKTKSTCMCFNPVLKKKKKQCWLSPGDLFVMCPDSFLEHKEL